MSQLAFKMGQIGDKVQAASIILLTLFWSFNVIISAFAGATEDSKKEYAN